MKNELGLRKDLQYRYTVDCVDGSEWNAIIPLFRDAVVNQTWAYGHARSPKMLPSCLILKRNDQIVAAAMTRIVTLPVFKVGIAYVGSGPMWRLRGEVDNIDILRESIKALKEEYVLRRGLFLRILPNMFTDMLNHDELCCVFEEEGFFCKDFGGTTLILDLTPRLDDLRRGLHQKWRNQLNCAERNKLTVRDGCDDSMFKVFRGIYEEMLARKQYATNVNLDEYEDIQKSLPENLKPRIVICESGGRPMAGGVFSVNGDTAVYLLGASSNDGLKCKASYLVQWHMIKMLKEKGFRNYDLGGCSPKREQDTYRFKARICGKTPELFSRIGIMEACENPMSNLVVNAGEYFKQCVKSCKRILNRL